MTDKVYSIWYEWDSWPPEIFGTRKLAEKALREVYKYANILDELENDLAYDIAGIEELVVNKE